eukprot:GEMP01059641.1.p1 GENE.GEMP01059641.1~~GEMP01059641.1.p1  ORF type:complete len:267 (+),score=26.58 GEMP01059641.1:81-881(+)
MATDLSRCFIPLSGELSVRDRRDDVCRFFIESLTVCFKGSSILPESLLTSWETKFHKRGSETLKSLGYRSFQDFLEQEPIARKSFELSPDGYVINRLDEKDETKQIANSRVIPRVAHVVIDDRSFASFLRALHSEQQAVGVATDGENVGIALSSTVFRCQFTRTAQLNSGLRCVLVRALVNIAAKQHSNDNSVAVGGAWKKEVEPMILRQEGRVSDAYQEIIRHHAMNLRPITWIDIDQESTWLNVKARQARLLVLSQVEYQHATK